MTDITVRPVVAVVTGMEEYQTRLISGIRSALVDHGRPLLVHANDPALAGLPPFLERLLRDSDPCGVITSPAMVPEDERALIGLVRSLALPAVHIGQDVPGETNVRGDNVSGMRALMAHLLDECGVRRPALVRGLPHQPDTTARETVFRQELQRRGLTLDEEFVVEGRATHDHSYLGVRALLARRADMDAVVAVNDSSALGALDALTDAGLRVPEDILVTGFDDDPLAALHWPGVTTIDQDVEGQGSLAATMLLTKIMTRAPMGTVVVPSHLRVRGTTAPRNQRLRAQLAQALTMNRMMQSHLAARDALIGLNRVLNRCHTTEQVATALASRLDHLGIDRCFLAVHDAPGSYDEETRTDRARLVLSYRRNRVDTGLSQDPFPTHRLLPDVLRPELGHGMFVVQPLTGLHHDLGYVLFEQVRGNTKIAESLLHDLSRALDSVVNTRTLEDHAATLESLVAHRTEELETAHAELQRSLVLDGLTRIANRTAFEHHLAQHWTEQGGEYFALLLTDVDLFKDYNEHYGHVQGDRALQVVASCLAAATRRPADLAARYGGEEFSVALPASGVEAAGTIALRFRHLLAKAAVPHETSHVAPVLTASIGIAVARTGVGIDLATVVATAEQALAQAKAWGRDRVAICEIGAPVSDG